MIVFYFHAAIILTSGQSDRRPANPISDITWRLDLNNWLKNNTVLLNLS